MKKTKFILITSGILILTISGLFFIKTSNDHKECTIEETHLTNDKGEKVNVRNHICKERFNM